jgi:hypothetical protein
MSMGHLVTILSRALAGPAVTALKLYSTPRKAAAQKLSLRNYHALETNDPSYTLPVPPPRLLTASSHCLLPLPPLIVSSHRLPPLTASSHCLLSLTASSDCLLSLPPLTASSHCLLSLPPLTASSHCLLPLLPLTASSRCLLTLPPLSFTCPMSWPRTSSLIVCWLGRRPTV